MIWEPSAPVTLETERYSLRSLDETDATERYLGWLKDPSVVRFLNASRQEHSIETIRQFIASHDNRISFLFGIFDKDGGGHVGNFEAVCDPYHKTAKLGVMIGDQEHWGRRVVLEVRAVIMDFLFKAVGMFKVYGQCHSNSTPAVFNYKAQGFTCEGILKSHAVLEGKRVDVLAFAMLRDDWLGKSG